ncbi:MAG TPA: ROK family protein [Blastocatellia bacterium]|nr:ROK family protein [Blastocatellia bacterium]
MQQTYLGVDLGGTQMRLAAVTNDGQLATPMLSVPTGKQFSPSDLGSQLHALHAQLQPEIAGQSIAAIGFGITGLVIGATLKESDFLPHLNNVDIVSLAEETLGYPAQIENDARCFVLAETRFGAARGARNVVGITLGTGAGGGVIVEGKLLRGAHANAGEVWSIPLRDKWLEYFVSTTGLVRGYQEAGGEVTDVDAAKMAELARGGDVAAKTAFASYGADVTMLCETIRALLDPEVVVIGGSIAQARDVFGDVLTTRTAKHGPRIAWAELGTAAGVIGAASLHM